MINIDIRAFYFFAALIFSSTAANGQTLDFTFLDLFAERRIEGRISLLNAVANESRCEVSVRIVAPKLWANLDSIARAEGNLGSTRNRLYWVGPTQLRSVDTEGKLRLTSKARYESWAYINVLFDTIKTKLFQDTKSIEFKLEPIWNANTNTLTLRYELENIRNVPGEIEQAARKLGAKFSDEVAIEVPRDFVFASLDPKIISGPMFMELEGHNGLGVTAKISFALPTWQCWIVRGTTRNPEFGKPLLLMIIDGLES